MAVATCPRCGCDLDTLRDLDIGDLTIRNGALVAWRGRRVKLTQSERLIVLAVARAGGAIVQRDVLAEVTGYEGEDGNGLVTVLLHRIRAAFRAIDETFDAIETVWRSGLRWRVE